MSSATISPTPQGMAATPPQPSSTSTGIDQPAHASPRTAAAAPSPNPYPQLSSHGHPHSPPYPSRMTQPYVLPAQGGGFWVLDPTKPPDNEEPPPYAAAAPCGQAGHHSTPHRAGTHPEDSPPRSLYHISTPPQQLREAYAQHRQQRGASPTGFDENAPLLGGQVRRPARGVWRSIFAGEDGPGSKRRRYWQSLWDRRCWRAVFHLLVLSFPFNLLLWPVLLVGTLVGTVLLLTLPLGAGVWFLTLIIARWGARVELRTQVYFHGDAEGRIAGRAVVPKPVLYRTVMAQHALADDTAGYLVEEEWDTRFWPCVWAMFCSHSSYAALSYFLLIKPLVVVFPGILLLAGLPVCAVLFPLLPIYLRAARRWGVFQAKVAVDNV